MMSLPAKLKVLNISSIFRPNNSKPPQEDVPLDDVTIHPPIHTPLLPFKEAINSIPKDIRNNPQIPKNALLVRRYNIDELKDIEMNLSEIVSLKYENKILIHLETAQKGSLLLWKKKSLSLFYILIHPNNLELGEFIEKVIEQNLNNDCNGIHLSYKIPDNQSIIPVHVSMLRALSQDLKPYPDLISFAKEENKPQLKDLLLNLYDLDAKINGSTQMEFACESKAYKTALLLLELNAKFPLTFNDSELPPEIENFNKTSRKMHDAIENHEVDVIRELLARNPGLKFFYDEDNESAMAHAIRIGALNVIKLLFDEKIGLGAHEDINEIKNELPHENWKDIEETLGIFHQPYIMSLIVNSHFGFKTISFKSKRNALYNILCRINTPVDTRVLLEVSFRKCMFAFYKEENNIAKNRCKDMSLFSNGRIYLPSEILKDNKINDIKRKFKKSLLSCNDKPWGNVAHALCHFVMLDFYKNNGKPYRADEGEKSDEFENISDELNTEKIKRNCPALDDTFTKFDYDHQQSELIAIYPQLYINDERSFRIPHYQKLQNFYNNCVKEMKTEPIPKLDEPKEGLSSRLIIGSALFFAFMIGLLAGVILFSFPDIRQQFYCYFELSIGGNATQRGQSPWFASLFNKDKDNEFFCGSSIISERYLLSAAHCFNSKGHIRRKNVYALLGAHNIYRNEKETVKVNIKKIIFHPDWNVNEESYTGDIVILELENEIRFNDFIRPIALPEPDKKIENICGNVIGYGKDESGKPQNEPKILEIKTVDSERCLYKHPELARKGSPKMFCGGDKGKVPCQGDSGGAFFQKYNGQAHALGIVSVAATVNCSENHYILFTNIVHYRPWIKNITRI